MGFCRFMFAPLQHQADKFATLFGTMDKKTNLDDYLADLGISGEQEEGLPSSGTPSSELHYNTLEPEETLNAPGLHNQDPLAALKNFLEGVVQRIDPALSVKVRKVDGALEAEIVGQSAAQLIGRDGHTLTALEVLAYTVLSKDSDRPDLRVHVDAAHYRRRRQERLIRQAESLATQVMKSGIPLEMDPLPAADRRIVHMTIKAMEGVTTESTGEGTLRHIVIRPV
jgi:spoIIIJ-associated protein